MLRRFSVNYAVLSILLDGGVTLLALSVAVYLRPLMPGLPYLVPVGAVKLPPYLYGLILGIWLAVFLLVSVYDPKSVYKAVDEFERLFLASGLASLASAGYLFLFHRDFSRWLLVTFIVINFVILAGWRIAARVIRRLKRWSPVEQRVVVIGAGKVGQRVGHMLDEHKWAGIRFAGYLDDRVDAVGSDGLMLGSLSEVGEIVKEQHIDDVIIALPQHANGRVNELIVELHHMPVRVRVVPDYFSLALHRATAEEFAGVPMISLRDPVLNDVQRMTKRFFDLVLAAAGVLVALPLMALITVIIRLDSSGPILFRQERVGENGRLFTMFKFRTMKNGAEAEEHKLVKLNESGEIVFKQADDHRITRAGRLLRRTSLDELPQLINVLRGEMSLVGPRPELPWLVDHYEHWQRKRFAVPQGITGWWQVNGRANKPMHLSTADDLHYIQNYSLWLDLYILIKTFFVVLRGTGAY